LKTITKFLIQLTGIDADISWIILSKIWLTIKGPVTIYFIIKFLSPDQQGLWYTFINLGTLSIFAELGFTTIITQFVSHEFAFLKEVNGILEGNKTNIERTVSLIRYSVRFYLYIIPISISILIIVGFFYFSKTFDKVFFVWAIYSVIGGANLLVSLFQAIYQGLDKIKHTQINILLGSLSMSIANWIFLWLHFNIWSLIIGNFIGILIMTFLLYRISPPFWRQIKSLKLSRKYTWFNEIMHLQWKYAVSWISGFFIFFLLVPSVFKYVGKVEAGQLGVTQAMINAISGIASSWVISKIPKFNMLVAMKRKDELDKLFTQSVFKGIIFQLVLSCFLVFFLILVRFYTSYGDRFLTILPTCLLLISQIAQSLINFMAFYMRAHKEEPLVYVSAINAILVVISIFSILPFFGLNSLIFSINLVMWLVILPITYLIFLRYKRNFIFKYYL